jgi:hypothetical protein
LSPAEAWFAETGAVVLAPVAADAPPGDDTLVAAFAELARDRGWRFGQVVAVGATAPPWPGLAGVLDAPLVAMGAFDPAAAPLLVTGEPSGPDWQRLTAVLDERGVGLAFALQHPAEPMGDVSADVVGVLTDAGGRRAAAPDPARAVSQAQHPAARAAGRRFAPTA